MSRQYVRVFVILILATIYLGAIVGCNTVEGAGEDVEEAGEAVQDAADGN
jgi:predicted small secreted protein